MVLEGSLISTVGIIPSGPERRGTTGASSNPVSAFCFEHVGIVDPDFDVEAPVVPRRTQLVLLRMPRGTNTDGGNTPE